MLILVILILIILSILFVLLRSRCRVGRIFLLRFVRCMNVLVFLRLSVSVLLLVWLCSMSLRLFIIRFVRILRFRVLFLWILILCCVSILSFLRSILVW